MSACIFDVKSNSQRESCYPQPVFSPRRFWRFTALRSNESTPAFSVIYGVTVDQTLEFASEIFKSGEFLLSRFIGIEIAGDLIVYERFVNAQRHQPCL
jgi:hypothetical protein